MAALFKKYHKKIMFEKIFGRHSEKPKGANESNEYPGISERGVEISQEMTKKLAEFLEKSERGTVMFIGGSSEAVRTKSTAKVYGDELKRIASERNYGEFEVITTNDINKNEGYSNIIENIVSRIKSSPDKKFAIDVPMFMKEFSMQPWLDEKGDYSAYTKHLLEKFNNDEEACVKEWLATEGKAGDLVGPNPTEMAKNHLAGLSKLKEFAGKYLENRSVIPVMVGHSWNLDALVSYLANNGEKADLEGYEKAGGKIIGLSEIAPISIKDGKMIFKYNNKEFILDNLE